MNLFSRLFHKETVAEKIHRLNFQRQREVQKWEASSPSSLHTFLAQPHDYTRWLPLDPQSRLPSHRPPKWISRTDAKGKDKIGYDGATFIHRRFVTYKIDCNKYEGRIIFKGVKPSSITRIDSQLRQLRGLSGKGDK